MQREPVGEKKRDENTDTEVKDECRSVLADGKESVGAPLASPREEVGVAMTAYACVWVVPLRILAEVPATLTDVFRDFP
jgi:hypothetical protein